MADSDLLWADFITEVLTRPSDHEYPPVESTYGPTTFYVPQPRPRKPRKPRPKKAPPPPPKEKTRSERLDNAQRLADEALRRSMEMEQLLRSYLDGRQQHVPEPFRVLGSPYPTTSDRLRAHWRRLVFKHHPDRGGDLSHFLRLKAAYDEAEGICEGRPIEFRWSPT